MVESYIRARNYSLIGLVTATMGLIGLLQRGLPDFYYPVSLACMMLSPVFTFAGFAFSPSSIKHNVAGGVTWLIVGVIAFSLETYAVMRFISPS